MTSSSEQEYSEIRQQVQRHLPEHTNYATATHRDHTFIKKGEKRMHPFL